MTKTIKEKVNSQIEKQLSSSSAIPDPPEKETQATEITLFFDPTIKDSFKKAIVSSLRELMARIESRIMLESLRKSLSDFIDFTNEAVPSYKDLIRIKEVYASTCDSRVLPNSVQHNVPAWTMFAMFFIVIPLAGNIIKERDDGSLSRLKTMPVSYVSIMLGKISVYSTACLIQALVMILMGMFVMPCLDLPALKLNSDILALFLMSFVSALAATGYGVAIGTIAKTHDQASTFGAVSTIIFAALGGIWIPVYIMPETMRTAARFSPLNWGLNGYYDLFLRDGNIAAISPWVLRLFVFFIFCLLVAFFYEKCKSTG